MQFGLFAYTTENLGDDIQSIATRAHIPKPDFLINRDYTAQFDATNDVKLICNGWFSHHPANWPPAPNIKPLLISMHICQFVSASGISVPDYFLNGENGEYLKHYGPVGARDLSTLRLLENAGIDAYFSGCMTLTLQRKALSRQEDVIALVDVSDEVVSFVRRSTRKQVRLLSATVANYDPDRRFEAANNLLAELETASCVVTTRLHSALPSLALGTPVYLIDTANDQYRFDGLNCLVRHGTQQEFLYGNAIDLNNPEPNDNLHLDLALSLKSTVKTFVESIDAKPSFDFPLKRLNGALVSIAEMRETIRVLKRHNNDLMSQIDRSKQRIWSKWTSKHGR